MGQFTILMNNGTKALKITNSIRLHRFEELVDKLVFIVEYQYSDDIDLRDFNVEFRWVDATGVAHVDMLEKEEEIYKDKYQRYFLPVTSTLNRYIGDNEGYLVFSFTDLETSKVYILKTDPVIIPILSVPDYYQVIPSESLDAISTAVNEIVIKAAELEAAAELYEQTKADNIGFTDDGDVQLKSHGEFIGDAISVAVPGTSDDEDEYRDGVVDLDQIYL